MKNVCLVLLLLRAILLTADANVKIGDTTASVESALGPRYAAADPGPMVEEARKYQVNHYNLFVFLAQGHVVGLIYSATNYVPASGELITLMQQSYSNGSWGLVQERSDNMGRVWHIYRTSDGKVKASFRDQRPSLYIFLKEYDL